MKSLTGKWAVEGHEGLVWEFTEFSEDPYFSGIEARSGRLREWADGQLLRQTQYIFYPDQKQLTIDRSDIEPDGFVSICYEEHCRVRLLDGNVLRII